MLATYIFKRPRCTYTSRTQRCYRSYLGLAWQVKPQWSFPALSTKLNERAIWCILFIYHADQVVCCIVVFHVYRDVIYVYVCSITLEAPAQVFQAKDMLTGSKLPIFKDFKQQGDLLFYTRFLLMKENQWAFHFKVLGENEKSSTLKLSARLTLCIWYLHLFSSIKRMIFN